MIDPKNQWCLQIDVTNVCPRACSNCTRLVGHTDDWYMEISQFKKCIEAVKDFPTESIAAPHTPHKLIGIIGGEPLLHPEFERLVETMIYAIPYKNRGLWTGLKWQDTKYSMLIAWAFPHYGIHNNLHDSQSVHTPVLVAVDDVVEDPEERQKLIDDCWLQRRWASGFTPGGFFCCEVMGCLASVFGQPEGLPIEPGCWKRPLEDFKPLIDKWCHRCGVPLNLKGRLADDNIDDMSLSNWLALENSPRVQAGRYHVRRSTLASAEKADVPWRYKR